MTLPRGIAVAAALLSAGLATGCAGSDSEPASETASAAPSSPSGPGVAWAGEVCSASTGLQESLRAVGSALAPLDPSASASSLDQARAQIRERVTTVQQSAAELSTALSTAPVGAGPELAAAQQNLQMASQRAEQAVDQLSAAGGQLADSQTAAQLARNLVTLKAALTGAGADIATYVDTLRSTIASSGQAVRDTFSAAPPCQDVTAAPTT